MLTVGSSWMNLDRFDDCDVFERDRRSSSPFSTLFCPTIILSLSLARDDVAWKSSTEAKWFSKNRNNGENIHPRCKKYGGNLQEIENCGS